VINETHQEIVEIRIGIHTLFDIFLVFVISFSWLPLAQRTHDFKVLLLKPLGQRHRKYLMLIIGKETALGDQIVALLLERQNHLLHIGISVAMRRSAVNVVAELSVSHQKNADVRNRAEINKLTELIADATSVNKTINDPLCEAKQNVHGRGHSNAQNGAIGRRVFIFVSDNACIAIGSANRLQIDNLKQ